jgi:hypothetical protein
VYTSPRGGAACPLGPAVDSQAAQLRRNAMLSDDGFVRINARIRSVGMFVIILAVLGLPRSGIGQPPIGGGECYDYHILMCQVDDCSVDHGKACGELLPGCAGEGIIECRQTTGACSNPGDEGDYSTFCKFEQEGGNF